MLFEEKESNLLEDLRLICPQEIFHVNDDDETVGMFNSIYDECQWKEWTDASSKDAPPPDFYNDTQHLMLEVMRVDDHGFKKKVRCETPIMDGNINWKRNCVILEIWMHIQTSDTL